MTKIILELMLSYFDATCTLEKEYGFIPTPGMEITFPEHTHIGTINMNSNVDFLPKWYMEKDEVRVFVADVNARDRRVFKKRLRELKKEGWEINDVFGVEDLIKETFPE